MINKFLFFLFVLVCMVFWCKWVETFSWRSWYESSSIIPVSWIEIPGIRRRFDDIDQLIHLKDQQIFIFKIKDKMSWTYFLSIDQSYCLSNCLMVLILLFLFWDFDLAVLVCWIEGKIVDGEADFTKREFKEWEVNLGIFFCCWDETLGKFFSFWKRLH